MLQRHAFRFHALLVIAVAALPPALTAAEKEPPKEVVEAFNKGVQADEAGDSDAAIAAYREAIAKDASFFNAHYNLALDLEQKGDLDGAISAFRKTVELKGDQPETHLHLAIALEKKGDATGARAEYEAAAKTGSPPAWLKLGDIDLGAKRYDAALSDYQSAFASNVEAALGATSASALCIARYNVGVLYEKKSRIAEAEESYLAALRLDPGYAPAHYNLGVLYLHRDERDKALAEFEIAAKDPNYPKASAAVALSLIAQKQGERGIPILEAAVAKMSNDAQLHLDLALADEEAGRSSDAESHARLAAELDPDLAAAHYALGLLADQAGRQEEALASYEKALKLDPGNAKAHNNLGLLLQASGKLAESVRHLEEAVKLKPSFAVAHYNLGLSLDKLGKANAAIDAYGKAIVIDPTMANAHFNLGNALAETDRKAEAVKAYQNYLKYAPNARDADKVRALIKQLGGS